MKKVILIIFGVILAGILLLVVLYMNSPEYKVRKQFKDAMKQQEEFMNQQNEIQQNLKNTDDKSKIFKDISIAPSQVLDSPSVIQGKANAYWFPEGWFEINLVDESGNEISSTNANANAYPLIPDKEGFIPFVAEISFSTNKAQGTLIFKEHDSSRLNSGDYTIPVKLK
jgi:hypothetical protein